MRKALLLALLLSGCAAADRAQLADGVTTIIGLNAGFSEANPVWGHASGPVIAATKIGVTQVVKLTPPAVCEPGLLGLTVAAPLASTYRRSWRAPSGMACRWCSRSVSGVGMPGSPMRCRPAPIHGPHSRLPWNGAPVPLFSLEMKIDESEALSVWPGDDGRSVGQR